MTNRSKFLIILVLGMLALLVSACDLIPTPAPVCAAVYNVTKPDDTDDGVCSPGDCSLREAVSNANACSGNQTINLPAGGYVLTIEGDNEDDNKTGDLDIKDDLVIIGTGAPSINGNIERAFHVHSGPVVTMEGIWLTDGDAIYGGGLVNEGFLTLNNFTCNYNNVSIPPGGMGDAMGGCIFNTGVVHINNGHFLANTAGYGGAIYNLAWGAVNLTDSTLTGNTADHQGGAIWNDADADVNIISSTLDQNTSGYRGGAIWTHGTVLLQFSTVEDNHTADYGGGVYLWEGFVSSENSWLTLNTAGEGAGIYNEDGMLHLYESSLTANTANGGMGGGIYNNGPSPANGLLMFNSTISSNTAVGGGGGIYNDGQFDIRFSTIANNAPEGLRIDGGLEIKLRSSALANNTGGDCAGITPDSLDYNIVADASCALIGPHDLLSDDPLLEPLGFHGSTGPSHPLGSGSPAIDSGVPDLCTAHDQNFIIRPQGPLCDRGAFENEYEYGILRGWTYIDANRNDIRDGTDGSVSGVIMELKEGSCPGGSIVQTTESSSPDGFYEMLDIEPGDYCIDTSPLQQTMYPEYIDVSFAAGDVLEDVNFRYLLSPLGDSSLSGLVWHDLCAVPYGSTTTPPPGCISLPGGGFAADGIYDPSEPGIEGVKVKVFGGACPALPVAPAAEIYTDVNGEFTVGGLEAGTWCVVVDALETPNDTILIPGSWTYPDRNANPSQFEVVLGAAEDAVDINFGWDYQFLPIPVVPYSIICPAISQAHIRRGPGTDFLPVGLLEPDEEFEILAKSEFEDPLWLFGMTQKGLFGWISFAVVKCQQLEPEKLLVEMTPLRIITPTPVPGPSKPLVCSSSLNETQCLKAGGRWLKETCICPTPTPVP